MCARPISELKPDLLLDWDYKGNPGINPETDCITSRQRAVWRCQECGYQWEANILERVNGRGKCPKCNPRYSRKLIVGINDLATLHPELLIDWDYEGNSFKPTELKEGSNYQASWKCHKCGHKWTSRLDTRTRNGSGCPVCNTGGGSSCADFLLYLLVKHIGARYRSRIGRYEADVLIGNNIIEYDGCVWHTDEAADEYKDSYFKSQGFSVYRIKERDDEILSCSFINKHTVTMPKLVLSTFLFYKRMYLEILRSFNVVDDVFVCSEYYLSLQYEELKSLVRSVPYGSSMQCVIDRGIMSLAWDYKKNIVSPKDVYANANSYAWVLCSHNHSSKMRCDSLVAGYGCPVCSGQVIPIVAKDYEIAYNLALFSNCVEDVVKSGEVRNIRKTITFICPICKSPYKMEYHNVKTTRLTRHCSCTKGSGIVYIVMLGSDEMNNCYYCAVYKSRYFLVKASVYDRVLLQIGRNNSNSGVLDEGLYRKYIGDPYLARVSWSRYNTIPVTLEGKRFIDVTSEENIVDCYINLNRQINGLPTI